MKIKINSEAPDEGASFASIGVDAFLSRGRYRGNKKEPDASGEVYGETPEARATSDSGISVADLLDLVNAADGIATAKKRYVLLANCVKLFTLVRKSEYLCCDKTHTTVLEM